MPRPFLEEMGNIDASPRSPSTSMKEEILSLKKELEGAEKMIGKLESQVFSYENLSDRPTHV